jgi:methyl-accepting chemotaxis protein
VSTETARRPRSTAKGAAKKSASARPSPKSPAKAARTYPDDDPMKALLEAMIDVRNGDFSVQLPQHWDGLHGKLAEHFNEIVRQNCELSRELSQVGQTVGREGQTRRRITPAGRRGEWAQMEQSVNTLIDDLVRPIETMTEAMAAVAKGDLSRTVPLEADGRPLQGEFLRAATIVNRMLEQMGEFSAEVTRVALEVGTAGLLGGQAKVKGVSGVWKELTDSVNQMASNLTAWSTSCARSPPR